MSSKHQPPKSIFTEASKQNVYRTCQLPRKYYTALVHVFISAPSWNIAEENRRIFKNANISSGPKEVWSNKG